MKPTAYLLDGMAYVFRSFFAMRSMSAPDGTPINAVFGLGMTLQKFLHDQKPELLGCCLDAGSRTFRNDIFPDYKANRGAPPEELIPQFDLCRELVEKMGIATYIQPGFEADDLIATLTRQLTAQEHEVVIVTGDKDLSQLIAPGVRIYNLAKDDWWDEDRVPVKMGVPAEKVCDLLALTGDPVDNIPGVRGVGPKAACALLEHFESLEAIYADLAAVESLPVRGARGLRKKLEDGWESAQLSRQLVQLDLDAPCELNLDELAYSGADSQALEEFADRWGLGRVAARVPRK